MNFWEAEYFFCNSWTVLIRETVKNIKHGISSCHLVTFWKKLS